MTIHFGFKVTRRISDYIVPFSFGGFNYRGKIDAQLRLHQKENSEMTMTFWPEWRLTWGLGLYIKLNTNYEFDIVWEKEAINIYCNGILRVSISDFGHQPLTYVQIGRVFNDPNYDTDSDYEFYDIFCIKKVLKPDPNKPIGAVFHPEYCYHHMYDDFGTKIK